LEKSLAKEDKHEYSLALDAGRPICCLIGVLFVMAPQVVHKLNQKTISPILRLDLSLKVHRITGVLLLAVGAYLCPVPVREQ